MSRCLRCEAILQLGAARSLRSLRWLSSRWLSSHWRSSRWCSSRWRSLLCRSSRWRSSGVATRTATRAATTRAAPQLTPQLTPQLAPLIELPQWATRVRRARRERTSRVALAAAVEQGCSRNGGDLLPFSVASRRPCLASFLWSPLRAERGSGAWSDRRRARDAHTPQVALAAAVEQGRSRAVLVFSSCSSLYACRSARAAPSLHPRRRVARSPRARARRTQRTARRARRMWSPSAARSRSTRSVFAGSRQTTVLGFALRALLLLKKKES